MIEDNRVAAISSELMNIRSVPYLMDELGVVPYGRDNLGQIIAGYVHAIEVRVGETLKGECSDDAIEKPILVLGGLPKAGKTWVRRKVDLLLSNLPYLKKIHSEGRIAFDTWEDAELSARLSGEIVTPHGLPLKPFELRAGSRHLELKFFNSLEDPNIDGLVVEAPIFPRAMVNGRWVGRELGGTFARKFAMDLYPYNKYLTDAFWVGLVSGPRIRHVEALYQADLKRARSLFLATKVAERYGKEVPTEEEWLAAKKEGATFTELEVVEVAMAEVLDTMEAQRLVHIPGREVFEFAYSNDIRTFMNRDDLYGTHRAWAVGFAMRRMLKDDFKVPSNKVFIGYNNPDFSALNIKDPEKLARYLKQRRKL